MVVQHGLWAQPLRSQPATTRDNSCRLQIRTPVVVPPTARHTTRAAISMGAQGGRFQQHGGGALRTVESPSWRRRAAHILAMGPPMYPVARAAVLAPHLAFAHVVASHATAPPTALPFNGVTPTNQAGMEIVTVRADADICPGCETCIGKLKTNAATRIVPESAGHEVLGHKLGATNDANQ